MADLISRAAAIEALGERPYNWTDSESEISEVCAWENHKSAIENIPSVDAVPVVRCRDCKYWETDWKPNHSIEGEHFCPMISLVTSGEWFCAYGERRDEDAAD